MLELVTDSRVDLAVSDARHGWGCFETLRVQDGAVRWLDRHLARLAEGCAFLGLGPPPAPAEVEAYLRARTDLGAQARATLRLIAVDGRLLVRRDPPPPAVPTPARACLSARLTRGSTSPLNRFKTLSYLENRLLHAEAEARGCFEALALNEHGRLTDGGRTTLLVRRGGRWLTPPTADGALPGVARGVLVDAGLAEEASLGPDDLAAAEGAVLVNALRGVIPLAEVEGVAAWGPPPEALGPLTLCLA